jgi:hypothetical protein
LGFWFWNSKDMEFWHLYIAENRQAGRQAWKKREKQAKLHNS